MGGKLGQSIVATRGYGDEAIAPTANVAKGSRVPQLRRHSTCLDRKGQEGRNEDTVYRIDVVKGKLVAEVLLECGLGSQEVNPTGIPNQLGPQEWDLNIAERVTSGDLVEGQPPVCEVGHRQEVITIRCQLDRSRQFPWALSSIPE